MAASAGKWVVMCESCNVRREQFFAEIRDLMNYSRKVKGPLSQKLSDKLDSARAEGLFSEGASEDVVLDAIRASMIATRCAGIAQSSPETVHHGEPLFLILGQWAGEAMSAEIMNSPFGRFMQLLGDDDPDEE